MSLTAERPDPWRWIGAPAIVCLTATLIFAAPIRFWGLRLPEPVFGLVLAYAWAVLRPSVLAPIGLLALGLALDLIWGGPLGLWALGLVTAYGLVLASRNMLSGQGWPVLWAAYVAACAAAMGVGYGVVTFQTGAAPDLLATLAQFVPTAVLYPFADRLIRRFEDADIRFR